MNHHADFELVSNDKNERLTIIIDRVVESNGRNTLKGNIQLDSNKTLIKYKTSDLSIKFTEGELNVEEVSKKTGVVKLKAKELCTLKKISLMIA